MSVKKLLDEHNPENTVVSVVFNAENEEYECVGVLTKESDEMIRVAFSAKNDTTVDYLDIPQTDIVSIDVVDPSNIEFL